MPKENNLENGCMLVNPAILEEAGVTDQPATWQELIDNAVKATNYDDQGRITRAGFQFTDNDTINFLFLAMILQQGANYWADDGVHVNFQTDAAKKAWQDEVDLVTKYHVDDETSYTGERYRLVLPGQRRDVDARPLGDPGRPRGVPGHGVRLRQPATLRGDGKPSMPPSRAGARSSTSTPRPRSRKRPGSSSTSWPSRTMRATGISPPTPCRR